jgi:hypothetical protein
MTKLPDRTNAILAAFLGLRLGAGGLALANNGAAAGTRDSGTRPEHAGVTPQQVQDTSAGVATLFAMMAQNLTQTMVDTRYSG